MEYKHDCDKCRYLSTAILLGTLCDFYYCDESIGGGTLIARYGNKGWEYTSTLVSIAKRDAYASLFTQDAMWRYALSLIQ